ncbi:MAG: N-acetylmuramoyl-L-alanine amidase [Bacteroidota bacterium]
MKNYRLITVLRTGVILLFFNLVMSGAIFAADYFQAKALPGDGIYSMLRRYQLDGFRCNFDQFYQLNRMRKGSGLSVGKSYLLPIEVFEFDGRTIRSTIGNDDWNTAVKIRDYNLALVELGLLDDSYDKTMRLLVPHHIDHCTEQTLSIPSPVATDPEEAAPTEPSNTSQQASSETASSSAAGGKRMFPIFGADYAYTPLASTKLRGQVYYIVSGHGGPDPGAMGQRGDHRLCEDEYAYDVALRLCRNLIAHGATAYMINRDPNDGIRNERFLECDTDEVIWGDIRQSRNQKTRLTQRSDVINGLYEKHRLQGVTQQQVVVIHVDSRSRSTRTDLFFYHHPSSEEGLTLARKMHRTMRQKYRRYRANGEYHGTVTARDLHMTRECTPTTVYIELANIRNNHDQQRIVLQRNRELLADWMLEGLMSQ